MFKSKNTSLEESTDPTQIAMASTAARYQPPEGGFSTRTPTSPSLTPNSTYENSDPSMKSVNRTNYTPHSSKYAPPSTAPSFQPVPPAMSSTYAPPRDFTSGPENLHSNQNGNANDSELVSIKRRVIFFAIGMAVGAMLGAVLGFLNVMFENLPATQSLPQIIEFGGFFALVIGLLFSVRPDRIEEIYHQLMSKNTSSS